MAQKAQELINLIKANTKIIQIISYETLMIHAHLAQAASEIGRELYLWNRIEGIKKYDAEKGSWTVIDDSARQADRPFTFFAEHNDLILLLEDFHPDMNENMEQPWVHIT